MKGHQRSESPDRLLLGVVGFPWRACGLLIWLDGESRGQDARRMKKFVVVFLVGSAITLAGLAVAKEKGPTKPATICPKGFFPSANVKLKPCPRGQQRVYVPGLEKPNQGPHECVSDCRPILQPDAS